MLATMQQDPQQYNYYEHCQFILQVYKVPVDCLFLITIDSF